MNDPVEPLVIEFDVACSPEHAFRTWTQRAAGWWPADHSVSGDAGLTVTFEPGSGGRIFECTPSGVEHDWGRVITWDPPARLTYTWHFVFDPAEATEVDVTFTASGARTGVRIEHRGWEKFGAAGADRRARNRQGWGGVIPPFQLACVAAPA